MPVRSSAEATHRRIVFAMPGNQAVAAKLAIPLDVEIGDADMSRFPDGEFHVRLQTPVSDADVAIVCTLDRPDEKVLPLLWLAIAAREGRGAPHRPCRALSGLYAAGRQSSNRVRSVQRSTLLRC